MPITARVPCCVRVVHGSRARGEQLESVLLVEVLHTVSHLRARDMRGRSHARQRGGGRRVRFWSGITHTQDTRQNELAIAFHYRFLVIGWVHTEEADHSSLMIKRMNCELTRLLRQQTSTQPGPTTSHETALGRTARASALVGRFAWSKTQEEDELVEVPNEDSEAVAAVLVVIRRDCGLLVLNRLIHNSVSLRKAPEGIGYR